MPEAHGAVPPPAGWRGRALVAGAALVAVCAGCGGGGGSPRLVGHPPPKPVNVATVSLPEARLDGLEREFAFKAAPGHVLFVFFGFVSCPDICPTTLSDLRRALEMLGGDAHRVEVAFVTVDLGRDSAAVLVPYLASFVERGHPLRPRTQAQLGRAEAAFGATSSVARRPDGTLDVAHTALAYVVDERGDVRVQWDFGTLPRDMAHDLRVLLRGDPGGRR